MKAESTVQILREWMQSRGLQILLAVEPLVKSQTSHQAPNELNF